MGRPCGGGVLVVAGILLALARSGAALQATSYSSGDPASSPASANSAPIDLDKRDNVDKLVDATEKALDSNTTVGPFVSEFEHNATVKAFKEQDAANEKHDNEM
jgi:hypothetical protein